ERAQAYADAGADAVVVHSRSVDGVDVVEVLRRLRLDVPIGVIPTTFYARDGVALRSAGASFVVYANHGLRAKVAALRQVFAEIYASGSTAAVEGSIASVGDVLELQARTPSRREESA